MSYEAQAPRLIEGRNAAISAPAAAYFCFWTNALPNMFRYGTSMPMAVERTNDEGFFQT
jgi:hypothetical protein